MEAIVWLPLVALAVSLTGALAALRLLRQAQRELDAVVDQLAVSTLDPCSTSGRARSWSSRSSP